MKENKTLNAAQRLEGLEAAFSMLDNALGNMMQNLNTLREAVTLMNDKVDAMITANERGLTVSRASVESLMVEAKSEELKSKVVDLIQKGIFQSADSVGLMSFIVGRELNKDTGEVVNPRIQFTIGAMNESAKGRLLEKKVGDSVVIDDNSPIALEIEEIYTIVTQSAPAPVAEELAAEESAPSTGEENKQESEQAPAQP